MIEIENNLESKTKLDYLTLLRFYTNINVELDKLLSYISSDKDTLKEVRKIIDKEMGLIVNPTITINK